MVDLPELDALASSTPAGIDPFEWDQLSVGQKLRFLRRSHHVLALPRESREKLKLVPSWVLFGPEDGLPAEWFNADGFLLPKFRKGGGSRDNFRRWYREYRRESAMARLAAEVCQPIFTRFHAVLTAISAFLGIAILLVFSVAFFALLPPHPIKILVPMLLLVPAVRFGQVRFKPMLTRLVVRCAAKRIRVQFAERGH